MPIYEYRCSKCASVIEKIQKFSDPVLKKHAGCGGALTKLVSQSSFQLKGSGWYVTDYAKKDSKSDRDADGTEDAGGAQKDGKKSDSNTDGDKKTGVGTSDASTTSDAKPTAKKPTKSDSNGGAKQ